MAISIADKTVSGRSFKVVKLKDLYLFARLFMISRCKDDFFHIFEMSEIPCQEWQTFCPSCGSYDVVRKELLIFSIFLNEQRILCQNIFVNLQYLQTVHQFHNLLPFGSMQPRLGKKFFFAEDGAIEVNVGRLEKLFCRLYPFEVINDDVGIY